jgi:hypothetical protein
MTDKERRERRRQWQSVRSHLANAKALEANQAPRGLIDVERKLARDATLRLWGWVGPMPAYYPPSYLHGVR